MAGTSPPTTSTSAAVATGRTRGQPGRAASRRRPPLEAVAQPDQDEADGGQRRRHARAVGQHEDDAEGRPPQTDRREQHDQRGRARDEAARDAHPDQPTVTFAA
ncbi:hypothetical protein [Geodermatophilus sp. URMC 64]